MTRLAAEAEPGHNSARFEEFLLLHLGAGALGLGTGNSGVDGLPPGIEKYDGTVYRQVILEVRICGNEANNGGITFGLCKYAIP